MSDRANNFLLDRAEPLFYERKGGSFVNFPRVTSVACFVVRCLWFFCATSFTLLAYRAGHLRTVHFFQRHLSVYLTPELKFITDIINKNLHSVSRSLEIHNCALTSSPSP